MIVGRIVAPWGLRGGVKVERHTDSLTRFSPGSVLYLNGQRAAVVRARSTKAGVSLELDAVSDRTQAESLVGSYLTVPRQAIEALPDGSYYHFQIIGIGVWTEGGEHIGAVKQILNTGSNDVYVVRDEAGKEVLVPAVEGVVLQVSPAASRMVVRLIEGMT